MAAHWKKKCITDMSQQTTQQLRDLAQKEVGCVVDHDLTKALLRGFDPTRQAARRKHQLEVIDSNFFAEVKEKLKDYRSGLLPAHGEALLHRIGSFKPHLLPLTDFLNERCPCAMHPAVSWPCLAISQALMRVGLRFGIAPTLG